MATFIDPVTREPFQAHRRNPYTFLNAEPEINDRYVKGQGNREPKVFDMNPHGQGIVPRGAIFEPGIDRWIARRIDSNGVVTYNTIPKYTSFGYQSSGVYVLDIDEDADEARIAAIATFHQEAEAREEAQRTAPLRAAEAAAQRIIEEAEREKAARMNTPIERFLKWLDIGEEDL